MPQITAFISSPLVPILAILIVLGFVILLLYLWSHHKKAAKACGPCTARGQPGEFTLEPEEELVVVSYPGPPRTGTSLGPVPIAHELGLPALLPILTVTNHSGRVDVFVETWPHEHWFDQANPLPTTPEQPNLQPCEQEALTYAKVFPEEGQPGIVRNTPLAVTAKVEARPIYFVALDSPQSTTVYGNPPGSWIRLRAGDEGARGSYCFSWCCPEPQSASSENGPPPLKPPYKRYEPPVPPEESPAGESSL